MTNVILHGCNGKMGQMITELAKKDGEICIVAGVDHRQESNRDYPVYDSLKDCKEKADVVIDFSIAGAVDSLLEFCREKKLPVVLCTTGLSEEQLKEVARTGEEIPVLKSANMSVGINTLFKILGDMTRVLANKGYDMEIIEKHHNQKVDAPSGTALALAAVMNDAMDQTYHINCDRTGVREKRKPDEIGIAAVRGGTIVGEHEVLFAGEDEVITITHTAYSRAIFGKGAIEAAKYLPGKAPGMYDMQDVIQ